MRKCGICNLYVESEAKFCPYCGKRIYTAVSTEFEDEEVKLKSEEYKYNGVNEIMMKMTGKKKRVVAGVLAVILALAMIIPAALVYLV